MRFPMVQPFTEMTRTALGSRLAPGASEYLDMFHDDAVFKFPFGPGGPVHIEGKPAMADYLASIEGSTVFERFNLDAAYPIRDGGMILEYHCKARAGEAGPSFEQNYVAVVATDGGRIRLYREYLDALIVGSPARDRNADVSKISWHYGQICPKSVSALSLLSVVPASYPSDSPALDVRKRTVPD